MKAQSAKTSAAKSSSFNVKSLVLPVLAIVFFCYVNSLFNDYNMDDEIVTINHKLTSQGISAIPEILKSPYFQSDIYSYEYRPVVHISFAIEHQFFGESPFVSHVINLILYLILVYIAYQLLQLLLPDINKTVIAGIVLLFALHPTHTEVVSSIKNRDELFALLFSFLAWRESIRFIARKQWWRAILVTLFFTLAMGAKVTVLSFAVIITLSLLVLFSSAFLETLLIAFILASIVALWIQNASFSSKLLLVFSNVASVLIFYAVTKRHLVIDFLKAKQSNETALITGESTDEISVRSLFAQPPINWILLGGVATTIVLFLIYGVSGWAFSGLIFACALFYLLSPLQQSKNFWLIVTSLVSLIFMYLYESSQEDSSLTIAVFMLLGFLFFKRGLSKWILIFFLCVFSVASLLKGFPIFTVIFLLNYYSRGKLKLSWGFTVLMIVSLIGIIINHFATGEIIGYNLIIDTIFVVVLNVFLLSDSNKDNRVVYWLLLYLFCALIGGNIINDYSTIQLTDASASDQINRVQTLKVDVVPTQTYRPVMFAEFPVDLDKDPLTIKLGTSLEVLLKYLKLITIPYPLSYYYGYSEIAPMKLTDTIPIISLLIHLILALGFVFAVLKKQRLIAYGLALYFISIFPFSALFAPIPGVIADRYLFAPSLGFALVITGLMGLIFKMDYRLMSLQLKDFAKPAKYTFAAILVCYSLLTIARNNDWKDRLTLFRNDIKHLNNSAQAHNLLALNLNKEASFLASPADRIKLIEEAVPHFQRAIEIWPEFMNATYDLGRSYESLGEWDKAIVAYKKAYALDTTFSDAIFRVGIVYESSDRLDSAIAAYSFTTQKNPLNITAFNNLSYCYFKKQEYYNAIETGKQTIKYHPTSTDPMVNVGKTYLHINQTDSALVYFEMAYPNRSGDKGLTEVLYKLWNEKGNMEKATFYYRKMQVMGMVR